MAAMRPSQCDTMKDCGELRPGISIPDFRLAHSSKTSACSEFFTHSGHLSEKECLVTLSPDRPERPNSGSKIIITFLENKPDNRNTIMRHIMDAFWDIARAYES
jgi:hypothetical protein